jgi:flagellar secretion chaperone FliS
MRKPALAYRRNSVRGATPLGLIVLLYDGVIAALQRAMVAIEAVDTTEKCQHLARAQAIILQLEGTLNFAAGGEVAQTLKALYVHARGQILKANIENSPQILRILTAKISKVREAWNAADHRPPDGALADSGPSRASQSEAQAQDPEFPPGQTEQAPPYGSPIEVEQPTRTFSA